MLGKVNRSDLFVLLWVLYYMQGTLYTSTIINQFIQVIMATWLLIVFFSAITNSNNPKLIKSTSALFIMYLVYGLLNIMWGQEFVIAYRVPKYFYLQKAINSLLPITLFYYYSRKGCITEERIRVYFFVFLITSLVLFNKESIHMYEISNVDQGGVTNNAGYGMLALIPMVFFFYKKPFIQYVLLAFILSFVLLGAKRGAILIAAICALYFIVSSFRNSKRRNYAFILGFVFICIGYYYFDHIFSTNEFLVSRYEQTMEGDSSNRDILYGNVWNAFLHNSSLLQQLIGHGADSTLKIMGAFAHQDWLEIVYNNGLVGVFLFVMFFVSYIINIKDARHSLPKWLIQAFVTILIIGFLKTLFSAFICQIELYMSLVIGYTLAELTKYSSSNTGINGNARTKLHN